jgi:hypothetical protein
VQKTRLKQVFVLFLTVILIASLSVDTRANASSVTSLTSIQLPSFEAERGDTSGRIRVVFTPNSSIAYYTLRIYRQGDGYDQAWLEDSYYQSGREIGMAEFTTSSGCFIQTLCTMLRAETGMKFSLQGFDEDLNPLTPESPKSNPYFATNLDDNVQSNNVRVTSSNTAPTSTLTIGFQPRTGQSTLSIRLYRSDNYAQVFREITNIPSGGQTIDVPGGYTYKYAALIAGSKTNDANYMSTGWNRILDGAIVYARVNPPVNVVITTGDRSISASWDTPAPVANVAIISFTISLSTDKINWGQVQNAGGSSARTITREFFRDNIRLTNGVPYWVRIGSSSPQGVFSYWYSSTPAIPSHTPNPPTLSAKAGDQRIDVSWLAPTFDGGAAIYEYIIRYSSDGSNWSEISANANQRTATISGLTNGTAYTVRGYARNSSGLSPADQFPSSVTPVGLAVPRTNDVTRIGTTSALLGMQVDSKGNTVTPVLNYGDMTGLLSNFQGSPSNGSSIVYSRELTGLTPGYHYQVRSRILINSIPTNGSILTFSTTPSAPSNVATTMTGTTAAVSWDETDTNVPGTIIYEAWAEQNGIEKGNRCLVFTSPDPSCEITGLTPGRNYVVKVTAQSSEANFGNGTSLAASLNVTTLAEQTIAFSFGTLPQKNRDSSSFDISTYGSTSSGLAITYSSRTLGQCILSGTRLTVQLAGTCTIRATQAGNLKFAPAQFVEASFEVAGYQTITFSVSGIGTQTRTSSALDLAPLATATSALTVEFSSSTPEVCQVNVAQLTYVGAGTCLVVASQSGNTYFMPAPNTTRSISVRQGTQSTLTLTSTIGTYGTAVILETSGGSGTGLPSFAIDTNSQLATATGCAVAGSKLISTSAGTCAVIATKSKDNDYVAKSSSSTLVTIEKATQIISFSPIAGSGTLLQGGSLSATARSTSSLTVTISSTTTSKCTVSGTSISLLEDGICTLRGTQSGNSNFEAATPVTESFEISPKPIPETSPIVYTRLVNPNSYKVGDTVQLSVQSATHNGSVVDGSYQFVSTNPEDFSFGPTTRDSDGVTYSSVTFTRAAPAFNLYAVFTPTDTVNYTNGQTFAAIQVAPKSQSMTINSNVAEYGQNLAISFSGITSKGLVNIDLSPMTHLGQPANIQDQRDHCTITDRSVTRDNPGFCYVRVNSMGDGVFESSFVVGAFAFTKQSQTIVLTNTETLDSITALDINSTVDLEEIVSATSALTPTVASSTSSTCSISSLILTVVSSGVCQIDISQSGDDSFQAAEGRSYSFAISRLEQDPLDLAENLATFGSPLSLSATGGSGSGQAIFTTVDGLASGCQATNGSLQANSAGTCLVTIEKSGDSTYLPKSSPPILVEVARANQTVTFDLSSLGTQYLSTPTVNLRQFVSATSGGNIALLSTDRNVCSISDDTVTLHEVGTCTVTATQEGTNNFLAATSVTQSFTIEATRPTVTPPPTVTTPPTVTPPPTPATPTTPTPTPPSAAPSNPGVSPEQVLRRNQTSPRTPSKGLRTRTIKFTMTAPSRLPLRVSASGSCRSTPVFKNVTKKVKVGKKITTRKVRTQTGWIVTFTKKGACRVRFKNSGNRDFLPLDSVSVVAVK